MKALSTETPDATSRELRERGETALKLFHQAVSQGISITPTICVSLLKTQPFKAVFRELEYLETLADVVIPLECYELAIMSLHRRAFDRKKAMVSHMLKRYAEGKISADSSDMEALMIRIMQELAYEGRPSSAHTMLRLFEEWILSDEAPLKDLRVPLECFNITLNGWTAERDAKKVEETFNRLLSYYEAGHSSLLPSADSFATLLQVLLSTKDSAVVIAEKGTRLLDQLLKLYESTGNDVCRPNEACFRHVITAVSKAGAPKEKQALSYLKQMQSMGVTPSTSSFNMVMYMVLSARHPHKFFKVLSLMHQMEKAGVEPDVLTYKNMIRACNKQIERDRRPLALSVAVEAIGQLRKSGQTDAGSYGLLAMALGAQMRGENPEKRDKLAFAACRLCYEDGFLNKQNTDLFRHVLSKKAWVQLTEKFSKIKAVKRKATQQTDNGDSTAMQ